MINKLLKYLENILFSCQHWCILEFIIMHIKFNTKISNSM